LKKSSEVEEQASIGISGEAAMSYEYEEGGYLVDEEHIKIGGCCGEEEVCGWVESESTNGTIMAGRSRAATPRIRSTQKGTRSVSIALKIASISDESGTVAWKLEQPRRTSGDGVACGN